MKRSLILALAVNGAALALGGIVVHASQEATCPVTGQKVTLTGKTQSLTVNGQKQYFCCADCPAAFVKNPAKYLKGETYCPVMTRNKVDLAKAPRVAINDNLFFTCCGGCPNEITSHPQKYLKETHDPVSGAAFQVGDNLPQSLYKGVHYLFANEETKKTFDANPGKYANKLLSTTG